MSIALAFVAEQHLQLLSQYDIKVRKKSHIKTALETVLN